MKFRLTIAAGLIILSIYAFFVQFYSFPNIAAMSGNDDSNPCAYVPYADSFLSIDMNGRVLSVTAAAVDGMPVIEGLKFQNFTIGGCLETDNDEVFNTIALIIKLLKKYDLNENFINQIDVSNLDDIHLYTDNVDVAFGSSKDADEKIRTLKEIMANLRGAENVKGVLDIRVIGRQYIFTVLT